MVYFSHVGNGLEGAEAGSRQATVDAAVQSAAAHVTVQLGPALFYTLLHGSANIETCIQNCTYKSAHKSHYMSLISLCVYLGDRSADFRAVEEDPGGVFSH